MRKENACTGWRVPTWGLLEINCRGEAGLVCRMERVIEVIRKEVNILAP